MANMDGLDPQAKPLPPKEADEARSILEHTSCNCGCSMEADECRTKDPSCTRRLSIERDVTDGLRHGDDLAAVKKLVREKYPVLGDAREIPTLDSPATGSENAEITLVEFGDFQCPGCAMASTTISGLLKDNPRDIRFVFKQFPLAMHADAELAAEASLAAAAQGRFWQMYRILFNNQKSIDLDHLRTWAKSIGLDTELFLNDLRIGKFKPVIQRDISMGKILGVSGTPAIFINGRLYKGKISVSALEETMNSDISACRGQCTVLDSHVQ